MIAKRFLCFCIALGCLVSRPGSASDPYSIADPCGHERQTNRPVDLADFLLARDFVVEATIERIDIGRAPTDSAQLHVEHVELGALPHRKLIVSGWRNLPGPDRLLAWGLWNGRDTPSVITLLILNDGGLSGSIVFRFHGRPMSEPGTFARLTHELSRRHDEHVTEWLTSGSAIGIAAITGESVCDRLISLSPGRVLVGSASHWPRYLKWPERPACPFAPIVGDSLLMSLADASPDTVQPNTCLEAARVPAWSKKRPYYSPFGVKLDSLGKAVVTDGDHLRLVPVSEE